MIKNVLRAAGVSGTSQMCMCVGLLFIYMCERVFTGHSLGCNATPTPGASMSGHAYSRQATR